MGCEKENRRGYAGWKPEVAATVTRISEELPAPPPGACSGSLKRRHEPRHRGRIRGHRTPYTKRSIRPLKMGETKKSRRWDMTASRSSKGRKIRHGRGPRSGGLQFSTGLSVPFVDQVAILLSASNLHHPTCGPRRSPEKDRCGIRHRQRPLARPPYGRHRQLVLRLRPPQGRRRRKGGGGGGGSHPDKKVAYRRASRKSERRNTRSGAT